MRKVGEEDINGVFTKGSSEDFLLTAFLVVAIVLVIIVVNQIIQNKDD